MNCELQEVDLLVLTHAGVGLADGEDTRKDDIGKIAKHYNRTDFAAIGAEYDAGDHDELLWPSTADEGALLSRFQQELVDGVRFIGTPPSFEVPDELQFNPIMDMVPVLDPEEYAGLVTSIREQGLLNPIWLHPEDHTIIDGRARYKACKEAGKPRRYQVWNSDGPLYKFVLGQNDSRRHMTTGQRAIMHQKMKPFLQEVIAKSKSEKNRVLALAQPRDEGGRLMKVDPETGVRANSNEPGVRWNLVAAKASGGAVGATSIAVAEKLFNEAPGLYDRVWDGELTLHGAIEQLEKKLKPKPAVKLPVEKEIERIDDLILKGCRIIHQAGMERRFGEVRLNPITRRHAASAARLLHRALGKVRKTEPETIQLGEDLTIDELQESERVQSPVESLPEPAGRVKRAKVCGGSADGSVCEARSGAFHLPSFVNDVSKQLELVETCLSLGGNPAGFYHPATRRFPKTPALLQRFCLGRHWNERTGKYGPTRDDVDGLPVQAIPESLVELASMISRQVGMEIQADIAVVNLYGTNARLGMHQDKDESAETIEKGVPVISVSLGWDGEFLLGGTKVTIYLTD